MPGEINRRLIAQFLRELLTRAALDVAFLPIARVFQKGATGQAAAAVVDERPVIGQNFDRAQIMAFVAAVDQVEARVETDARAQFAGGVLGLFFGDDVAFSGVQTHDGRRQSARLFGRVDLGFIADNIYRIVHRFCGGLSHQFENLGQVAFKREIVHLFLQRKRPEVNPGSPVNHFRPFVLIQSQFSHRGAVLRFIRLALALYGQIEFGALEQERWPFDNLRGIDVQFARDVENYEVARTMASVSVASEVAEAFSVFTVSLVPVSTSGSS